MATNTTTQTAPATEPLTRQDLTRLFARLRHEMNGLVDDAHRRTPFYAKSKEEAQAKAKAAAKVLEEFADRVDLLKKENS